MNGYGRIAGLAAWLLTAALGGVAVAQDEATPAEATLATIARSRVILLVEVDRRDPKAFGGMTGSTFWFRVKEVLRFETEPGTRQAPVWQHDASILAARCRDLSEHDLLEWSLLYSERDQAAARADAALTARFQSGKTFVLAAPTTAWFATTGVVVPHKWGSLHPTTGAPLFVPADAKTVAEVRGRLDQPDRAPPYKAPPPPQPPHPDPSQGRGGGSPGRG